MESAGLFEGSTFAGLVGEDSGILVTCLCTSWVSWPFSGPLASCFCFEGACLLLAFGVFNSARLWGFCLFSLFPCLHCVCIYERVVAYAAPCIHFACSLCGCLGCEVCIMCTALVPRFPAGICRTALPPLLLYHCCSTAVQHTVCVISVGIPVPQVLSAEC